ncbi:hypothetical protein T4D_15635 [Trichinella pseudospiralis]|uniref:Uncharacterized protein n=1 Tax=Trichinella pseudospiralis TaxID=6337 RepID=A0A0V1FI36_TRIPS|nr:hypothetical protein T4D_15635 [Trichinella pseudospiralis]
MPYPTQSRKHAVSDYYANRGIMKIAFILNVKEYYLSNDRRCLANGVRRMNNGKRRRIEDGREGQEDDMSFCGTAIV